MGDKTIAAVILTIAATLIGVGIWGILSTNEPERVERVQTTAVQRYERASADKLDYEFELAYLDGCMGEGVSYQDCKCMYDFLDTTLTNAEFEAMAIEVYKTGETPNEVLDAVWACI